MTVRDLRECLYEVTVQDQEISEDNVVELMMLWTKIQVVENKIEMIYESLKEDSPYPKKIIELRDDKHEILKEIKNYICQ